MNQNVQAAEKTHAITMENRQKASLTGVTDVELFNEARIIAQTCLGAVTVNGQGLHVDALDLDKGTMTLSGKINGILYDERLPRGKGAMKRIFK